MRREVGISGYAACRCALAMFTLFASRVELGARRERENKKWQNKINERARKTRRLILIRTNPARDFARINNARGNGRARNTCRALFTAFFFRGGWGRGALKGDPSGFLRTRGNGGLFTALFGASGKSKETLQKPSALARWPT